MAVEIVVVDEFVIETGSCTVLFVVVVVEEGRFVVVVIVVVEEFVIETER